MNLLYWNYRGLINPRAVRMLHNWSVVNSQDLFFVSETMISSRATETLKLMDFSCGGGVYSVGTSGGLCVFWKGDKVDFSLVPLSSNHICGDIKLEIGFVWRFVGIYGWPETTQKFKTWELMRTFSSFDGMMIFGGD